MLGIRILVPSKGIILSNLLPNVWYRIIVTQSITSRNPLPLFCYWSIYSNNKTIHFLFPANSLLKFHSFFSFARSNLLQQDKNSAMFSLNFLIFTPFDSLMLNFSCSEFNFFAQFGCVRWTLIFLNCIRFSVILPYFWSVVFD